jgi:serine/threonine protein kinase
MRYGHGFEEENFRSEVRSHQAMKHPNVIQMLDSFELFGTGALVLELFGCDLAKYSYTSIEY